MIYFYCSRTYFSKINGGKFSSDDYYDNWGRDKNWGFIEDGGKVKGNNATFTMVADNGRYTFIDINLVDGGKQFQGSYDEKLENGDPFRKGQWRCYRN